MIQLTRHTKMVVMTACLLGVAGCSSEQGRSDVNNHVVQQNRQVYDLETTNLVVSYDIGQIYLTQADRNNISALIEKSKFDAAKDQIEIAAWADFKLPDDGSKLSSNDEKLASRRIAEITNFLKTKHNASESKSFNMAERSNWLARTFSTRDAELKSRFAKEEVAPMSDKDLEVIRANGAERKSVIVISHK